MDEYNESRAKSFYKSLENGIGELPASQREALYRRCAVNCVKDTVLKEMQRQFMECGCDLDAQYTKYGRSQFFFADIIESGWVYELGYPRCFCPMVDTGYAQSPVHCECSRQSILFVLETLLPDRKITVETMHTVLTGGTECRFRVTVGAPDAQR